MRPMSFPIVAEARMAERLLEAERARLARIAAAGHRAQARLDEPQPQASPSSRRRILVKASALAACLVLGGAVMLGDQTAATSVVPVRPTFREPEAIPASVCRPPSIGWPAAPTELITDLSILAAPYLALASCPWP